MPGLAAVDMTEWLTSKSNKSIYLTTKEPKERALKRNSGRADASKTFTVSV